MSDDLRAAIESAIDTEAETPDTTVETPTETSTDPAPEPVEAEQSSGTVRDALGRFVPKSGDTAAAAPPTATPATTPAGVSPQADLVAPQGGAAPVVQAPQSWSPVVREHWAALPPAVQDQIARREQQFTEAFRSVAPARQAGEQFMQAVQPFMPAIQAEGVDPITAVTNLMQFGARMRMGTPLEKAQTLAQLVKVYGVDVNSLDEALVGAAPSQPNGADPQYIQQAVQQALQPLMQAAQQRQQQTAQAAQTATRSEIDAFAADPKNEFFNDLADIVELGEKRGQQISLADAYHRAAMLHPEVSRVMLARQQGVNAQKLTQAAHKAKGAAVSVRGSAPVGNPNAPEPSSIRESIEAAIEAHSRV